MSKAERIAEAKDQVANAILTGIMQTLFTKDYSECLRKRRGWEIELGGINYTFNHSAEYGKLDYYTYDWTITDHSAAGFTVTFTSNTTGGFSTPMEAVIDSLRVDTQHDNFLYIVSSLTNLVVQIVSNYTPSGELIDG